MLRSGEGRARVYMNCSGKHAAMLATCVVNGWPPETYLDQSHPLQRAIRSTVEELTGERVAAGGVDGCGAPLFFVSMLGVTRAFRAPGPGRSPAPRSAGSPTPSGPIPSGRRAAPAPEAGLMRAIPGLMVKIGAEAFDAFAFGDGRAGTVKIEDGGQRARVPVTVAVLRALGFEGPELDELATVVLLGGGRPVGEIRVR